MGKTSSKKASAYARQVQDVMAKEIIWVDPQDTLQEALRLLVENGVAAMPVVNGRRKCVGVLSSTDLIGVENELEESVEMLSTSSSPLFERLFQSGLDNRLVQEVMTTPPLTVAPTESLCGAASMMLRNRVHRLIVIDKSEEIVGVISTVDILRAFVEGDPGSSS